MTVFVSYQAGAKGKFVTEVCDLSTHPEIVNIKNISSGNVNWITPEMHEHLINNNFPVTQFHGKFPEEENYQFYIDTVLQQIKKANLNFSVDTHYVQKCSLEYILSKGEKVIRIIVSNEQSVYKLQNNFFYKNFLDKKIYEDIKPVISILIEETHANCPDLVKDFDHSILDKSLNEWDKNTLSILFDACRVFTKDIQEPNIIVHENLLEIEMDDLLSIDTLTNIVDFVGGTMNDTVCKRIEEYYKAQEKITIFDEYIENFLNKK